MSPLRTIASFASYRWAADYACGVAPVFARYFADCHANKVQMNGFHLGDGAAFRGGYSGMAIDPPGGTNEMPRAGLDAIRDIYQKRPTTMGDGEIAYRTKSAGRQLVDFSKESGATLEKCRIGKEPTDKLARNYPLARRRVERGVRFILIMHESWSHNTNLNSKMKQDCEISDGPTAVPLKHLKCLGLLDSTAMAWDGEFGRTPMQEVRSRLDPEDDGRDHRPVTYATSIAGGSFKPGAVVGATDHIVHGITQNRVHWRELRATLLHNLGFDQTKLPYRPIGRGSRLAAVAGNVVRIMLGPGRGWQT